MTPTVSPLSTSVIKFFLKLYSVINDKIVNVPRRLSGEKLVKNFRIFDFFLPLVSLFALNFESNSVWENVGRFIDTNRFLEQFSFSSIWISKAK